LHAQEALKFCDEALKELQESGSSNVLSVMIGRGKNTDGVGKGKIKPTLRQFAKA
jgi:shikimate 5-dehydrogenase